MYEEVYQSSRTQDGAISAYLLGEDIIPPNKDPNPIIKEDIDGNKLSYAGGYLFCPKTGIYNYMFDEDLTSLYPSIIMTINISPETKIGKIQDWDANKFVKGEVDTYYIGEDKISKENFHIFNIKSFYLFCSTIP